MIWHKVIGRCHRTTQGDLQRIDWATESLVLRSRCGLGDQLLRFSEIDDIRDGQAVCADLKPGQSSCSVPGMAGTIDSHESARVQTKI